MIRFLVQRPIAVLMATLLCLILGVLSMLKIPISLMPDIDIPRITVKVKVKNKSAGQIESNLGRSVRNKLNQLNHLESMSSKASNGSLVVDLQFEHGTDTDLAFIEVNEKIDQITGNLPKFVDRPKVLKASASDIPAFYIDISSREDLGDGSTSVDFGKFVNHIVKNRIEQLDEVALVDVNGYVSPEILVKPDLEKLQGLGLSLFDIESAIKGQKIELESISVKDQQYQYNLRINGTVTNATQIENIYLKQDDRLFQIKELAKVIERSQERQGLVLANGKEAISLAVIKQSDARMGDLKSSIALLLDDLSSKYKEVGFEINRDQTQLLDVTVSNLLQSLLWGGLLALIITFVFIKDVRSSVLILISIPISLVFSFLVFRLLHLSFNIISLSGIILGIGLMIDNAIIVIDNISNFIEKGNTVIVSCAKGASEVFKPLLSSALTTCAVFFPLVFISGISGALFYDQALAVSIGLFSSLLVSLLILPVCYHLLYRKRDLTNIIKKAKREGFYVGWYKKGFRFLSKSRWRLPILFLLLIISTIVLLSISEKSILPRLTTTETIATIDWGEPIHLNENENRVRNLQSLIQNHTSQYIANIGKSQYGITLKSQPTLEQSSIYVNANSTKDLKKIKEILYALIGEKYNKASIEFEAVDNIFNRLFTSQTPPLEARLRLSKRSGADEFSAVNDIFNSYKKAFASYDIQPLSPSKQKVLTIDRGKLVTYDISLSTIVTSLKSAFNQKDVMSIMENRTEIPIILGGEEAGISRILSSLTVPNNDGDHFAVNQFVTLSEGTTFKEVLADENGTYYPIAFHIESEEKESIITKLKQLTSTFSNINVQFEGSIFQQEKLQKQLLNIFLITVILLYLILASQFESLTLPIIILLELPVAMAGSLFALWIFGASVNLMSMIGMIVMSGIIINDSILKIDTILRLQREGKTLWRAIVEAGKIRLKPILMTSLTTILALLPVMFVSGIGSELQAPLAIAMIGGMLVGTLVSLYFVPMCFYFLVKNKLHTTKLYV